MGTVSHRKDVLSALREELDERFPGTRLLEAASAGFLESRIPAVDDLLSGGLSRGCLSLFSGIASSGKTGLALAFAASCTQTEQYAAWVHTGGFSTPSAAHARVNVDRLLQVRVQDASQALRCADILLRWKAFSLVVIDWPGGGGARKDWNRLLRLVAGSRQVLLVLSPPPLPASPLRFCASLHLSLERNFEGGPFVGRVRAQMEKSRSGKMGALEDSPYAGMSAAPFFLFAELPGLGQAWHEGR